MRIYLAGPLFTLAERQFNEQLASAIQEMVEDVDVTIPQVETGKMSGSPDFVNKAFRFCLESIDKCDAVVAILDGADADSGTCVELGYAHASDKPIIGVRTDFRLSEDRGLNLMVSNICSRLIVTSSMSANIDDIAREIASHLARISWLAGDGHGSVNADG